MKTVDEIEDECDGYDDQDVCDGLVHIRRA
jgi:hypothetical protein